MRFQRFFSVYCGDGVYCGRAGYRLAAGGDSVVVSDAVREVAQVMLWELEGSRLRVTLAPSQVGHCWRRRIRVVEETNPEWYQRFCSEHSDSLRTRPRKRKKPDTYIKRAHTLRALNEIASGQARTEYAQRLMPYVAKEAEQYEREITRVSGHSSRARFSHRRNCGAASF